MHWLVKVIHLNIVTCWGNFILLVQSPHEVWKGFTVTVCINWMNFFFKIFTRDNSDLCWTSCMEKSLLEFSQQRFSQIIWIQFTSQLHFVWMGSGSMDWFRFSVYCIEYILDPKFIQHVHLKSYTNFRDRFSKYTTRIRGKIQTLSIWSFV